MLKSVYEIYFFSFDKWECSLFTIVIRNLLAAELRLDLLP